MRLFRKKEKEIQRESSIAVKQQQMSICATNVWLKDR